MGRIENESLSCPIFNTDQTTSIQIRYGLTRPEYNPNAMLINPCNQSETNSLAPAETFELYDFSEADPLMAFIRGRRLSRARFCGGMKKEVS